MAVPARGRRSSRARVVVIDSSDTSTSRSLRLALRETLGPRNATPSAIAGPAGVQRLTVYRDFAETAQFPACASCGFERHRPPVRSDT